MLVNIIFFLGKYYISFTALYVNRIRKSAWLLLILFIPSFLNGQLLINEVSNRNVSYFQHPDYLYEDWIEIYNAGSVSINLANFHLSDDIFNLSKWSFPLVNIGPKQHIIVFAIGKEDGRGLDENEILHANFKISAKGETLYLSNNSEILMDSVTVPSNLQRDHSYGRITSGATAWGFFEKSTPEKNNSNSIAFSKGYEPEPQIDLPAGMYSGAVTLNVTVNSPTAVLRYTLDGETPSENSALYSTNIVINSTATLKVRSFSTIDKLPSNSVTNTYFINLDATPAGILCLTTDSSNLYGATGIYDNYGDESKRPCYIEYFAPNSHQQAFEQNAAIKIDGGAGGSRDQPQRSFRIEPGHSVLGDGDLKYNLIPSRTNRNSYETFYLRNGSNFYLDYPCKDAISTRLLGNANLNTYAEYTPVQVYLNGQYWGWYELREKVDADYYKQHFGIDKDSVNILTQSYAKGGELQAIEGGDEALAKFNDDYNSFTKLSPESPTFWEDADKLFDMKHYVDYICGESWICNLDWPYNNIKIFRGAEIGNRWRFSIIDVESSFSPSYGWGEVSGDHIYYMLNYDSSNPYVNIWQRAMKNGKFYNYFINRFSDLMNTSWRRETVVAIANELYYSTKPELEPGFSRWYQPDNFNQLDDKHDAYISDIRVRNVFVRGDLRANFDLPKNVNVILDVSPAGAGKIKISTITPDTYPWSGIYFDGVPIKIEAIPNAGYTFDRWDDNSLIAELNKSIFDDTITVSGKTFKAYFQKKEVNENENKDVTISEINYSSIPTADSGDWIEFWNYNQIKPADISKWHFTDNDDAHIYTFPVNTVIPANGRIVVVENVSKFKKVHPLVNNLTPQFDFGLGAAGDAVKLYDSANVLIAEVNFLNNNPWPADLSLNGSTLELLNHANSLNDASNWFEGCVGGSPGSSYSSCMLTETNVIDAEANIKILPNPTSGLLHVSLPQKQFSVARLYDGMGNLMLQEQSQNDHYILDLSTLPSGLYFIQVELLSGHKSNIKVLKI